MKSSEPNLITSGIKKPPPYPVDDPITTNPSVAPDPHATDLVSAVQYGYYDRVVELIESQPNLASTPVQGTITLLHWAALNDRVEIARYLLNKGAHIDAIGGELNSTPLHWAVRDGKLSIVIFLLSQQAQPDLFDDEGYSSLHLASMFGHTDIVAYLIAKGQDINLLDKHGMTPLMHAVSRSRNRDPTQLLIRLGSQINYQNPNNKYTALHYAATGSNKEIVQMLLDADANVDIRNFNNETPYDLAAESPAYQHLTYLLSSKHSSYSNLPKCLQFTKSSRRLGTTLSPYLIIFLIACVFQFNISLIYKGVLVLLGIILTKGYVTIFFDNHMDQYLPIAIAQASIFWLYICYFYYFLPYVHVISFTFVAVVILTYLSWSNYYLAQKRDPGIIVSNRDQLHRNIIQLVEQNLFDYEQFCTSCLIRRPIRSKHCRDCHRCIAKFDHHCPWIDNCVGEKNIRYFTGFLFFTPLCLCFYLHGAYLYYRDHCHVFSSDTITHALMKILTCSPPVLWFTLIAILYISWVSSLCITILTQVANGYTTNEAINSWRYKYLRSKSSNPFSLGYIQNLVDLMQRPIFFYTPVKVDWSRIYSIEDFYQAIPLRIKQKLNLSSIDSSMELLNV